MGTIAERRGWSVFGGWGGVCVCVAGGGGVHCLIDHQKEGIIAGIPEQRICQEFVHYFIFFFFFGVGGVDRPSFAMLHYSLSCSSNFSSPLIPHCSIFFWLLLAFGGLVRTKLPNMPCVRSHGFSLALIT